MFFSSAQIIGIQAPKVNRVRRDGHTLRSALDRPEQ
jgi:hypothetical protein